MQRARVNGRLVTARSDSPETAFCPCCGGRVDKRKRRGADGRVTFFYRHAMGVGDECPLRYRPVA